MTMEVVVEGGITSVVEVGTPGPQGPASSGSPQLTVAAPNCSSRLKRGADYSIESDADIANPQRVICQAIADAATVHGGATVRPIGEFDIALDGESTGVQPTTNVGQAVAIALRDGVSLVGEGQDLTILRLKAGQPLVTHSGGQRARHSIFHSYDYTAGVSRIRISDLTIDGDSFNQDPAVYMNTILLHRGHDCIVERVRTGNVIGGLSTAPGGSQEVFNFEALLAENVWFLNNIVENTDAGNHSSGFSADWSSLIRWYGNLVRGPSLAEPGMTMHGCAACRLENNIVYGRGGRGFNCENSQDIDHVGNVSGYRSRDISAAGQTSPWFTSDTLYGNALDGFSATVGSVRIRYLGDLAIGNGAAGFNLDGNGSTADVIFDDVTSAWNNYGILVRGADVRVRDGSFLNNTTDGINAVSGTYPSESAWSDNLTISGHPVFSGNLQDLRVRRDPLWANGAGVAFGSRQAPTIPTAGTDNTANMLINPFGVGCFITVSGGSGVSVRIGFGPSNVQDTGMASGTFYLAARQRIGLGNYTGTPAWLWNLVG